MNTSLEKIELGDIRIDLHYKNIKNIHLSVHPPSGRVTVSAPSQMETETIRLFCISKLAWIRKQQAKLLSQKRESPREYITKESHYFLGLRYLLIVKDQIDKPKVVLKKNKIELFVHSNTSASQREKIFQAWYRKQLNEIILPIILKYEKRIRVKVGKIAIRKMKTKWGSCKPETRMILLNTELAKKSIESIEYVLVHEMIHLLERGHNDNFIKYMNKYLPNWEHLRIELNRSTLGHVEWEY